ncbi:MAG: hypothetical protein FWE22_08620 [Firmicutes bacterium]|nr:hypothetical protein [Bacillota bacterium]
MKQFIEFKVGFEESQETERIILNVNDIVSIATVDGKVSLVRRFAEKKKLCKYLLKNTFDEIATKLCD